jgi:hypothetical protein
MEEHVDTERNKQKVLKNKEEKLEATMNDITNAKEKELITKN